MTHGPILFRCCADDTQTLVWCLSYLKPDLATPCQWRIDTGTPGKAMVVQPFLAVPPGPMEMLIIHGHYSWSSLLKLAHHQCIVAVTLARHQHDFPCAITVDVSIMMSILHWCDIRGADHCIQSAPKVTVREVSQWWLELGIGGRSLAKMDMMPF